MVILADLIDQVDDYLGNFRSLADFKKWFYPLAYGVEKTAVGSLVDCVEEIELVLAEASSANWSDADLKAELAEVISPYRVRLAVVSIESSRPFEYASSLHGVLVPMKLAEA